TRSKRDWSSDVCSSDLVEKNSAEYDLLKKVEGLLTDRTALNRSIREEDKALNDAAEERIEQLTNDEIDTIMHDKWFGNLIEKMRSEERRVGKEYTEQRG